MFRKLLRALLLWLLPKFVWATHIVGGGFDIQHISGNWYRINLVVYRDCTSLTDFNRVAYVGIYDKNTHDMISSIGLPLRDSSMLNSAKPMCVVQVPGCTQKAYYSQTIELTPQEYNNTAGYYISWERCCRNGIIQNILEPGGASMAFYAEFPSPARYLNSTPKLDVNPFTVLCYDNLFNTPLTFTDGDGDSLVYKLVTPINGTLTRNNPNDDQSGQMPILNSGPYKDITWLPGFSDQLQIPGNPAIFINSATGEITVKPSVTGVYVVGVAVFEYRNGVKIGEVHLELQYTIVPCLANDFPDIKLFERGNVINTDTVYVNLPDTAKFGLTVFDNDSIDVFSLQTSLDSTELSKYVRVTPTITPKSVSYNITWASHCGLRTDTVYWFTLTARDKGCPIPKTSQRVLKVKFNPLPLGPQTDILCLELHDNKSTLVYFGDSVRNYPYFKSYKLYRADVTDTFRLLATIGDRWASRYLDESTPSYDVINYRYMMRVENWCGYLGKTSDSLGTFDQLKYLPDKQFMYNVSVAEDKVLITWNQTKELDFARYFLWKGYRNQSPQDYVMEVDFTKQTDTVYLDTKVQVNDTSHCYYLVMLDTCGNYGPIGQVFCTTVLRGKPGKYDNRLFWQSFVKADEYPVTFDLHKYAPASASPVLVGLYPESTIEELDTAISFDDGKYVYEVDVLHEPVGHSGVYVRSTSNKVELLKKPYVFVPTAFSPNGDGINDEWNVADYFVKDFMLKVYNRWGQLVFETNDKNRKWDGNTLQGVPAADDLYIYTLMYGGWYGELEQVKGQVSIIR